MAAGGKYSQRALLRRFRSEFTQAVLAVIMLGGLFAAAVVLQVAAGR